MKADPEEAYVQGFLAGQENGIQEAVNKGQLYARPLTSRQIRDNEWPHSPYATSKEHRQWLEENEDG